MARLTPVPFTTLLRRMRREAELCGSIFDLPSDKWFAPKPEFDFSVRHFSGRASTPVGPAAGPQTQMAQNIVLSWLAGGSILELKTVQVNDHLEIPRPSMHIPNLGYNVEWSQELSVAESLREYAKAAYLIAILSKTGCFGLCGAPDHARSGDTLYDASVGYDLEGIRSEKVGGFLRSMLHPAAIFDELRAQLTGDLRSFRELELPAFIADCVTLSTFHGCPADQIEAIARYLLTELGLHVVIKFNPTLLGLERVRELVVERLGYHHLTILRDTFERDLQYDQALEMLRRLQGVARDAGREIGAKFTNTLIVANNPALFPTQPEPYMYLSGPPLHVLAMTLMQRWREDFGFDLGVSFSAGIDRKNFASAVACGMVPVTTCTDLLRQGGYARLPRYLEHLREEMQGCGVTSVEAYVLAAFGHGAEAAAQVLRETRLGGETWNREGARLAAVAGQQPDGFARALREVAGVARLDPETLILRVVRAAGHLNGRAIVPGLSGDPRYHARSNQAEPRRVARTLGLYDCINCDLCITACPNDAIFFYSATPVQALTQSLQLLPGGGVECAPGAGFVIRTSHQIAVVEGLCNECSNCDMYCPEHGAPYKLKERVFLNLEDFRARRGVDGFCRSNGTLFARLGGAEMQFETDPDRPAAVVRGEGFELDVKLDPLEVERARLTSPREVTLDTALLWRMKTAWESLFHSARPNMVNPEPLASGVAQERRDG